METTDEAYEPIYHISAINEPYLFKTPETILPFVKWGISIENIEIRENKFTSIMFKCTIDFETLKILDYVFITRVPVYSTLQNGNLRCSHTQKYHHNAADLIAYVYSISGTMLHMDDIKYTTGEELTRDATEYLNRLVVSRNDEGRNYKNIIIGLPTIRTQIYQTMIDTLKELIFEEYPNDRYHDVEDARYHNIEEPQSLISKSG